MLLQSDFKVFKKSKKPFNQNFDNFLLPSMNMFKQEETHLNSCTVWTYELFAFVWIKRKLNLHTVNGGIYCGRRTFMHTKLYKWWCHQYKYDDIPNSYFLLLSQMLVRSGWFLLKNYHVNSLSPIPASENESLYLLGGN